MSTTQANWIRFVAEHNCGFATPADNGGINVYTYAVDCDGCVEIVRDVATSLAEVRAILGY